MSKSSSRYGVIVVGAGHAGCEAALVTARAGLKTLILAISLDTIASLPGSPALGGEREKVLRNLAALGGEMPQKIRESLTHKGELILNGKKRPLVLVDKREYFLKVKHTLEKETNLDLKQVLVSKIFKKNGRVEGVKTLVGQEFRAKVVILAAGTFLRGRMFLGKEVLPTARLGELPANELANNLEEIGFPLLTAKKIISLSLDKKTLNLKKLKILPSQPKISPPFLGPKSILHEPLECYLTFTNPPLFLQPEGRETGETYVNGLENAAPSGEAEQIKMVKKIPGLEAAEMMRPGYSLEHQYLSPPQIKASLETKLIKGLFVAGEITGPSVNGPEEAALQGFVAGKNAIRHLK